MNTDIKTILITGGAKRIGRALASHFATLGYNVAIQYNTSKEEAESFQDTWKQQAAIFQADLSDENTYSNLIDQVHQHFGHIDALINNASAFVYDTVKTVTRQSWDNHMHINLRAPFVLSQRFFDLIIPDQHGNIINIIDQRVWNLTPHFMSYTLSKSGLWTLTQTLAMAMAPNVRVNAIGPGPTLAHKNQTHSDFERQYTSIPLMRPTALEDICKACQFIIETPSLTGQMIALDGGQHLGWTFPQTQPTSYD